MFYDSKGKTLSVWFDDPTKETLSEEAGDGVILSKDKTGKVIGFEKLYVDFPQKTVSRKSEKILQFPVFNWQ